ncbi:MAG: helix-turn-helix transcriptional regulator [Myxococcota bacterium]
MQRAASLDDFRREPRGRYLAGPSWLHFCAHAELFGVVLWSRPSEEDMRSLVRTLLVELDPRVAPHRSLVDASRLEGVDAGAFSALSDYVHTHRAPLSKAVTRLALVRPNGMEGALVAGFFHVLDAPYPVNVVDNAERGLTWLGERDAAALARELSALQSELSGVDPLVGQLRAWMVARLVDAAVERAAVDLGVSERTLQRRLQTAGTTFNQELTDVRIREAQRRMLDSDAPLTNICLDVGFGSLQHFSAVFRRAVGEAPSVWRSRRTGKG